MRGKRKAQKPDPSKELPSHIKVGYLGSDPELQGTQWAVPRALVYPKRGTAPKMTPTAWIESKALELAQQQAAEAEPEQRDQAVLATRLEEQRLAEEQAKLAAEQAAAEAAAEQDRQRKSQLKAELKADVDRLASANLQAAAALQAKEQVISDRVDQSEARINGLKETVDSRIAKMMVLKGELDERLNQIQIAEGSNSLNIFRLRKEVDSIKQ